MENVRHLSCGDNQIPDQVYQIKNVIASAKGDRNGYKMAGMSPLGQLDASPRGPAITTPSATQSSNTLSGHISPAGTPNPDQQFRSLQQQLYQLNDTSAKEEVRLKAAQELSDNLDVAIASPHYQQFLDTGLRVFLKILKELPNHSIAEYR